jgi:hypothetical protein
MSSYSDLLVRVRESSSLLCVPEAVVLPHELHLQALWFSGQMGRDFTTVDGRKVRVVQFGHWNHAAGPDFLHAAVEIDGVLQSGPLELDHRMSDWEAHGHAVNEAFDQVVLHVVFVDEGRDHFTRTSKHRAVPQVVVPEEVLRDALNFPLVSVADAYPGRWLTPLAEMDPIHLDRLMVGAARHRAVMKARRRSRTVEVLGEDEWCWQVLAETLGYRPNRLAMTLLAQRLPVAKLLQMPEVAESVLLGAAGFLTAKVYEQAAPDSQEYLRGLWERWWQIRDEFEPVAERRIPWKFSGIRPVNHPQRRLSCLAMVLRDWAEFKKACSTPDGVVKYFEGVKHPYWSYHYTLKSKRSERSLALIGGDRIRDFQMNHLWPPLLAVDDKVAWERYLRMPPPALSEKVDKASVRLFGDTDRRKTYLRKAWQHQALLQIYQDFCLRDVSECQNCPFPEQLAQWKGV